MLSRKSYPDEQVIWTPENNPSLLNKERTEKLLPSSIENRDMILMTVAKKDNLLSVGALNELNEFNKIYYNFTYKVDGVNISFPIVC
jgi:hypothetical protein